MRAESKDEVSGSEGKIEGMKGFLWRSELAEQIPRLSFRLRDGRLSPARTY